MNEHVSVPDWWVNISEDIQKECILIFASTLENEDEERVNKLKNKVGLQENYANEFFIWFDRKSKVT